MKINHWFVFSPLPILCQIFRRLFDDNNQPVLQFVKLYGQVVKETYSDGEQSGRSCIISFDLNGIMQLTQFYNIATKVNSGKSAITFGDLPDWWVLYSAWSVIIVRRTNPAIHYDDVRMSMMVSQITSVSIVYPAVSSGPDQRKHQISASLHGLCEGNSPVTSAFPTQRASSEENVSTWWRHHGEEIVGLPTSPHLSNIACLNGYVTL